MNMLGIETAAISLVSAVGGGVFVALVTHVLTRRREADRRRAEKIIGYRIQAWRGIADQTGRPLDADAFEKALAEIILFGNEKEVQLVSRIMDDFVAQHTSDTTELLKLLRRNIREELGLKKTSIEFRWLRISDGQQLRVDDREEGSDAKSKLSMRQARPVPSPLVGEGLGRGGRDRCHTLLLASVSEVGQSNCAEQ